MSPATYTPGDPVPRSIAAIDWSRWQAVDQATLVFIIRDGQVLLIHKKRGLGAGKINGPGGRLENGETPLQAALREVEEEVRVTPLGAKQAGELLFQFVDGYSIHVFVFRAPDCVGDPVETDEARPIWTPLDSIPYERMWADDRIWLPPMLRGERFKGSFVFEGDQMLDHQFSIRD